MRQKELDVSPRVKPYFVLLFSQPDVRVLFDINFRCQPPDPFRVVRVTRGRVATALNCLELRRR